VSPELEEAEALIAKGDLKKALKKIESARKKALGAQDLLFMEEVLASAEMVKEQADGGLRDSSDKHIKTIRWNLDFLQGKSHGLQAQPKVNEASPRGELEPSSNLEKKGVMGATDHPQAEKVGELAENKLRMKLGVKRELKGLVELLAEDEEVLNLARGEYDDRQGLVVLTDRRVLFTERGMMRSRLEDFPYDRISSVQTSTGMVHGTLKLFVSGNAAEIKDVYPKERAPEIGDYIRSRIHQKPTTDAPPAQETGGPPASDPVAQLKQLAELRDAGIVTPEEFEAKKAELLSRM
jgi:Bacterial PH domain/Short C-terminal domain